MQIWLKCQFPYLRLAGVTNRALWLAKTDKTLTLQLAILPPVTTFCQLQSTKQIIAIFRILHFAKLQDPARSRNFVQNLVFLRIKLPTILIFLQIVQLDNRTTGGSNSKGWGLWKVLETKSIGQNLAFAVLSNVSFCLICHLSNILCFSCSNLFNQTDYKYILKIHWATKKYPHSNNWL